MTEQVKLDSQARQIHMVVDGHTISLCFSEHYNPTLASLVKGTLIDGFLRKSGIGQNDLTEVRDGRH